MFVSLEHELQEHYVRLMRHFHCRGELEPGKMYQIELSRMFTLLSMLTPETMVYYSAKVGIYRRVAELVGNPLQDGQGVVATFQCSMEAMAAVLYALIPKIRQQGDLPVVAIFEAFPGAIMALPAQCRGAWEKQISMW